MAKIKKSILQAARGAILELADYELEKVMSNINDINTNPTKRRTIDIKLTFVATDDRKKVTMLSQVKSKVEPTKPVETTLFNVMDKDPDTGEIVNVLREALDVAPGQIDIHGNIQREPEQIVIGYHANKVVNERKGA